MQQVLRYSKFVIWPSLVLVLGLLLLQWLYYRLLLVNIQVELYSGGIAILFLALGYFLSQHLKSKSASTVPAVEHTPAPLIAPNNQNLTEPVFEPLTESVETQKSQSNVASAIESTTEITTPVSSEVLSARELEVLQLMAKGYSNQQIADSLFISLSTVKTHCSSIYVKLDVKRRTGAVDKARALGLLV